MTSLMPDNRRARIVSELRSSGMLRATELADRLGVAPVTIRRDIVQMTDEGILRRVRGGAELNEAAATQSLAAGTRVPMPGATLGMIVPTLEYYWPGIVQGAKAEAELRSANLVLRGSSYESTTDRAQIERLLDEGVDGLLLAPDVSSPATPDLLAWLAEVGVPTVLVERDVQTTAAVAVESVNTDHDIGALLAVSHLVGLGHRRIAIMASSRSPHRQEIVRGWDVGAHHAGAEALTFPLEFAPVGSVEDDVSVIERALGAALEAGVTAVLVHADREAMTLAQLAQHRGLSVPDDLSVVAYDDEVAELFTPPLTAIRPPRYDIGVAAVSLVTQRIANPDWPAHRIVVAPQLRVRSSTGRPPATPDPT